MEEANKSAAQAQGEVSKEDGSARLVFANLRVGFACNSSSSHSMVMFSGQGKFSPDMLAQPEEKARHFMYAFASDAQRCGADPRMAHWAAAGLFGQDAAKMAGADGLMCSGEPGHSMVFPRMFGLPLPHLGFAEDLLGYVMQKGLAFDYSERDETFAVPYSEEPEGTVAKFDPKNGHWTLFSRQTGSKARFRFEHGKALEAQEDDDKGYAEMKASSPELADVKITEKCAGQACAKHCYQASGPGGKHARLGDVLLAARVLSEAEVFEAALGGGDALSHPMAGQIVKMFADLGVKPNLTTRQTDWLSDKALADAVHEHCGAVAFSADNAQEAEAARAKFVQDSARWAAQRQQDTSGRRARSAEAVFQHVVGVSGPAELEELMRWSKKTGHRLTLLGFKTAGRGKSALAEDEQMRGRVDALQEGWTDIALKVASKGYLSISIDTALAQSSEAKLAQAGIGRVLFHTTEGRFSAYVDAVRMKTGASSYEPAGKLADFGADFLDQFESFAHPAGLAPRGPKKPFAPLSRTEAFEKAAAAMALGDERAAREAIGGLGGLDGIAARALLGYALRQKMPQAALACAAGFAWAPGELGSMAGEALCFGGAGFLEEFMALAIPCDTRKPALWAAAAGDAESCRMLARHGKDPDVARTAAGLSALEGNWEEFGQWAAANGLEAEFAEGFETARRMLENPMAFDEDPENMWDEDDAKKARQAAQKRQALAQKLAIGLASKLQGAGSSRGPGKAKAI